MKPLTLTKDILEQIVADFAAGLQTPGLGTDRIIYNKDLSSFYAKKEGEEQEKVHLTFSRPVYDKMMALVKNTSDEIGWHCLVERKDKNNFYVYDILVHKQYVTSAHTTTDEEEYALWMSTLDDDTFFAMRMQGHSHVRMGTGPSGDDVNHRNGVIGNMKKKTGFYIFLITNYEANHNTLIFDFDHNRLIESSDVVVHVEGFKEILDWCQEQYKKVEKAYQRTGAGAPSGYTARPGYGTTHKDETKFVSREFNGNHVTQKEKLNDSEKKKRGRPPKNERKKNK